MKFAAALFALLPLCAFAQQIVEDNRDVRKQLDLLSSAESAEDFVAHLKEVESLLEEESDNFDMMEDVEDEEESEGLMYESDENGLEMEDEAIVVSDVESVDRDLGK